MLSTAAVAAIATCSVVMSVLCCVSCSIAVDYTHWSEPPIVVEVPTPDFSVHMRDNSAYMSANSSITVR